MEKSHPGKQNPGHSLLKQIPLDVPYLKFHAQIANRILHKCLYTPLALWWFWQPHSQPTLPSSSFQTTAFPSFFFFLMEFMAVSVLPLARWGRKKARGRGSIYTVCLYSVRACCRVGSCDVCACIVWERILSGTAAGKINGRSGDCLQ